VPHEQGGAMIILAGSLWVIAACLLCGCGQPGVSKPVARDGGSWASGTDGRLLYCRLDAMVRWQLGDAESLAMAEPGLYVVWQGETGTLVSRTLHPYDVRSVQRALRSGPHLGALELTLVAAVLQRSWCLRPEALPATERLMECIATGAPHHPYYLRSILTSRRQSGVTDRYGRLPYDRAYGTSVLAITIGAATVWAIVAAPGGSARSDLLDLTHVVLSEEESGTRVRRPFGEEFGQVGLVRLTVQSAVEAEPALAFRGEYNWDLEVSTGTASPRAYSGEMAREAFVLLRNLPEALSVRVVPRDLLAVCVPQVVHAKCHPPAGGEEPSPHWGACALLDIGVPNAWVEKDLPCNWTRRPNHPSRLCYRWSDSETAKVGYYADEGGDKRVKVVCPASWTGTVQFFQNDYEPGPGPELGRAVVDHN